MKTTCFACVMLCSICGAAHANLIVNGSFEESSLNPGSAWNPMNGGNSSIVGWTTFGAGIDYLGTIIAASDGIRSIDINNLSAGGGIAQSFDTVEGWIYTVEFDISANMFGGPTPKVLMVSAAGQSEEFEFDYVAAGATAADPAWERVTWSFVATSAISELRFQGVSDGVYGAAIDNVVVTGRVPASSTLAGCAALGAMTMRRRRR